MRAYRPHLFQPQRNTNFHSPGILHHPTTPLDQPPPFPTKPNPQLRLQNPRQRCPIPQIHPLPSCALPLPRAPINPTTTALNIIKPLRPTDRRTQPDLPVRRLFVQDVGAGGREGEG